MKDCCIVIPIFKNLLSKIEQIFFENNIKLFKDSYDIFLICSYKIDILQYYNIYKNINIIRFDNIWISTKENFYNLCLNTIFYENFKLYKFMLICHTDSIIFYDNLKYFLNFDLDYIGAPYINSNVINNEGISLRKVQSFYNYCNSTKNKIKGKLIYANLIKISTLDISKKFSLQNDIENYYDLTFNAMAAYKPWVLNNKYLDFYKKYKPFVKIIEDNIKNDKILTIEEVKKKIEIASNLLANDIKEITEKSIKENKIPKIIHFCFFNWKNMSNTYLNFLKTWFENLPDWTFINWNINNFEINYSNKWVNAMYKTKQFVFLSDYIRAWAVYNFGGFYFDCDVICYKSLNDLLNIDYIFSRECWQEYKYKNLSFECGVFGAKPSNIFLKYIINYYKTKMKFTLVAPLIYIDCLNHYNIKIEKIEDFREYKYKLNKKDKKNIYLLNSKFFSNSNIKYDFDNDKYFSLIYNQYTSHEFTNSWTKNNPERYLNYFEPNIFLENFIK